MGQITASMVKELRETTGAGMMDCKQALTENNGEMESAIDWLRTKGLAKAAKKASRVAAEGLIGIAADGTTGAVVELNSETDFVARNEQFQAMVRSVADIALTQDNNDIEALKSAAYPGSEKNVGEYINEQVGTIGENMNARRAAKLSVNDGVVATYMHNQVADRVGKIGVLVAIESTGDKAKLEEFGRQVAMHVAAVNPLALTDSDVPKDVADRERAVYAEQARESGKPENIIEKMVEGRMRKFYEESVLLKQTFVIDGENTVEKAAELAASDIGGEVKIAAFVRFQLGEGIEKEADDFAAEVAKAAGQD